VQPVNINEHRFREALAREFPGLMHSTDEFDMLNLRFTVNVKSSIENYVNADTAYEQVGVLAERLRQDTLVKTGAARIVQAANAQAEQYRIENAKLVQMVADRDDRIVTLKARIADLQDSIAGEVL